MQSKVLVAFELWFRKRPPITSDRKFPLQTLISKHHLLCSRLSGTSLVLMHYPLHKSENEYDEMIQSRPSLPYMSESEMLFLTVVTKYANPDIKSKSPSVGILIAVESTCLIRTRVPVILIHILGLCGLQELSAANASGTYLSWIKQRCPAS